MVTPRYAKQVLGLDLSPKEHGARAEKKQPSAHEAILHAQIQYCHWLDVCEPRSAFHPKGQARVIPGRDWSFDFAWLAPLWIAVEIHGATWSGGRHVRGAGFRLDREKMREGQLAGWLVLEFTAEEVHDGTALTAIERAIELRKKATERDLGIGGGK